jgi:hypothetical protein
MNYKELVKQAVNKFLCWKLPTDFGPDGGISFDRSGHKYEPVGTNLFTATQTEQMFLDCLPEATNDKIGWLAESSHRNGAVWFKNANNNSLTWTTESNEALRFARKVDAETFIEILQLTTCKATEHLWIGEI